MSKRLNRNDCLPFSINIYARHCCRIVSKNFVVWQSKHGGKKSRLILLLENAETKSCRDSIGVKRMMRNEKRFRLIRTSSATRRMHSESVRCCIRQTSSVLFSVLFATPNNENGDSFLPVCCSPPSRYHYNLNATQERFRCHYPLFFHLSFCLRLFLPLARSLFSCRRRDVYFKVWERRRKFFFVAFSSFHGKRVSGGRQRVNAAIALNISNKKIFCTMRKLSCCGVCYTCKRALLHFRFWFSAMEKSDFERAK